MSCATELLHPANFCPVCGARLAAPPPDGSAATTAAAPNRPDATGDERNVVYLAASDEHPPSPEPTAAPGTSPPGSPLQPNPRAYDYSGVEHPVQPAPAGPIPLHPAVAAAPPAGSMPRPGDVQLPRTVDDNPFGDFFADGPSAWLEDEDDDVLGDQPRVVGTMLAAGAITMHVVGWAVWAYAMYRGSGGAEAGGFLLLGMLMWIWYLSLPREQQHRAMLRWHRRIEGAIDRRVAPIRARTESQLALRRERDRYRAMRDERTRRIAALGEGAYREFRQGRIAADLQPIAQRVMAIERQMLVQDHRIRGLVETPPAAGDDAPAGG